MIEAKKKNDKNGWWSEKIADYMLPRQSNVFKNLQKESIDGMLQKVKASMKQKPTVKIDQREKVQSQ